MKKIGLVLRFYMSYFFVSFLITLSAIYLLKINGSGILVVVFWYKVIVTGLIYYFINTYKQKEFYYYKNLGVSRKTLWAYTLSIDFILFVCLSILTLKIWQ